MKLIEMQPVIDNKRESWEKFERELIEIKYDAKHYARQEKIKSTKAVIKKFRGENDVGEINKKYNQREIETEELEFKIKCEDFWKKRDDPRREQLFRKMHPLIFLKE